MRKGTMASREKGKVDDDDAGGWWAENIVLDNVESQSAIQQFSNRGRTSGGEGR